MKSPPFAIEAIPSNAKIKLLKSGQEQTVVEQDRIDIRYITIVIRRPSAVHQSHALRPRANASMDIALQPDILLLHVVTDKTAFDCCFEMA